MSRTRWIVVCNGGPNGKNVGQSKDSLGKAIGALESMMKALGATRGAVIKEDGTLDNPLPVECEEDAGEDGGHDVLVRRMMPVFPIGALVVGAMLPELIGFLRQAHEYDTELRPGFYRNKYADVYRDDAQHPQ